MDIAGEKLKNYRSKEQRIKDACYAVLCAPGSSKKAKTEKGSALTHPKIKRPVKVKKR